MLEVREQVQKSDREGSVELLMAQEELVEVDYMQLSDSVLSPDLCIHFSC